MSLPRLPSPHSTRVFSEEPGQTRLEESPSRPGDPNTPREGTQVAVSGRRPKNRIGDPSSPPTFLSVIEGCPEVRKVCANSDYPFCTFPKKVEDRRPKRDDKGRTGAAFAEKFGRSVMGLRLDPDRS